MADKAEPLVKVTDFQLADEIRLARKRTPSDFKTILNYSNTLSDGLRVRRGYSTYTGIVYPTGLNATDIQVPMICQIESPSKEDVHIICYDSDPQVWMYPYWRGSTRINESVAIAEYSRPGFIPTFSLVSSHSFQFENWPSYGGSSTVDYYKGWKVYRYADPDHKTVGAQSTIITGFSVAPKVGDPQNIVATFTTVDDISPTGINFGVSHYYEFYRGYHDNHTFVPTYVAPEDDFSSPPCAISDNSLIYFSGGQGADSNLRGSIIYPRMNKTFFPGVTETFTIDGTYVSEEECKAYDIVDNFSLAASAATAATQLDELNTYWVGVAPIYDDGTIGELHKYETVSDYPTNAQWGNNYLSAASTFFLIPIVALSAGTLNKTVQGFAIYLAQDSGDTTIIGRQSAYFFVGSISLTSESQNVDTTIASGGWSYAGGLFALRFAITGDMWTARGNTYETDSGMAETQSDTSYAYSGRKVVGGRHYLYNVYVTSESQADKQNLFTNPTGQNDSINSGIIARRVFPNEQDFYRIRCKPEVGSRINAVIPTGFDEMLVLKNLGIVSVRTTVTQDLIPEHINRIVDHKVGCSTFHGYALSNQEEIYFAGYDDCYLYRLGQLQPLIERGDKRDWLHTYREVLTNTQKENVVVIWLPQDYLIWDFGQTAGNQYILDRGGWTQAAFNQSSGLTSTEFFKFPVKLNNGTVLALGTPGNKGLRQFQNPTTGAFYYTDAGVAVKTYLDTDYFNFGHDNDFVLSKIIFNQMFDATPSGTLSASLYRDRILVRVYNLTGGRYRIHMNSVVGDPKIGFEWRFIYNNNSSPQLMAGTQLQIDSIEIYGEIRSRSKRASEVVTVTNIGIWDQDTWDGGKSYG